MVKRYEILPEHTYNLDEKGFLMGKIHKSVKVFARYLFENGSLIGVNEDGNREWITLMAAICADGTWVPPTLIYAGVQGSLRDTWLDGFDTGAHHCNFAASPTGWTNDDLGFEWVQMFIQVLYWGTEAQ
jgi:hypothetical protein